MTSIVVTAWSRTQRKRRMRVDGTHDNTRETSTHIHRGNVFRALVHDGHVREKGEIRMVVRELRGWRGDLATDGHRRRNE
jgi:hypothetical protein